MKSHKFKPAFILITAFTFALMLSQNTFLNAQNRNAPNKSLKTKERMDAIKKMKLIEVLELNDEKAEKFLLKYNSYEKRIEENRRKMRAAVRELEDAIAKNSNDITAKTNQLLTLQEEFNRLNLEKLRGMKSELTDIEYAKFVNFENKFVRELFGSFVGERGKHNAKRQRSDGHNKR